MSIYVKQWKLSGMATFLKSRRYEQIEEAVQESGTENGCDNRRILEVGCGHGRDFLQFLVGKENVQLYGVDIFKQPELPRSVSFFLTDAESLPFDDGYFDVVVSIGVLEHIQPISKLARVITECGRVGRSFCHIVPSIATIFEPHVKQIGWQLRDHNKKKPYANLNYYSDEAWLQFEGFQGAKVKRMQYVPLLIQNLMIYKSC